MANYLQWLAYWNKMVQGTERESEKAARGKNNKVWRSGRLCWLRKKEHLYFIIIEGNPIRRTANGTLTSHADIRYNEMGEERIRWRRWIHSIFLLQGKQQHCLCTWICGLSLPWCIFCAQIFFSLAALGRLFLLVHAQHFSNCFFFLAIFFSFNNDHLAF